MANVNKVILIGNLTRTPETKYLPSGQSVTDIGMAINEKYKPKDGEVKETTTFVDVSLWGKMGEVVAQYCDKGSQLYVEGKLKLDQWETDDGQKRSKLSVTALNMQLLGGKQADGASEPPAASQAPLPKAAVGGEPDQDLPF